MKFFRAFEAANIVNLTREQNSARHILEMRAYCGRFCPQVAQRRPAFVIAAFPLQQHT